MGSLLSVALFGCTSILPTFFFAQTHLHGSIFTPKAGWILGVGGGKFEPDRNITRAEVMTMVNRMLDRVPHKDYMLSDMKVWPDNSPSDWYYEAVQEATNGHDYERLEDGVTEKWTKLQAARDWVALETEWATSESGK